MFSWICPQCGREVPPSKTDCPYCAERVKEAATGETTGTAAPPPPSVPQSSPPLPPAAPVYEAVAAPPPYYAPQYAGHAPQPQATWPLRGTRSAPPTWLMGIGFALAFLAIGAAIYFGIQSFSRTNSAEKAGLENPANASRQKVSNPLQKYVEVVGLRLMTDKKKPIAKFIVVNHSNTEINDLAANVTLWASTSRSEEDSIGSFSFRIASLGPSDSKELTEPLKTKLKMYELPDWQNATAEIQITSP